MIPLLMAGLLCVILLAIGNGSMPYALSPSGFVPVEGRAYRLQGKTIPVGIEEGMHLIDVCEDGACVRTSISPQLLAPHNGQVMVEGIWQKDRLIVTKLLRRCDGH